MKLYGLSLQQHLDAMFSEVHNHQSIYGFPLANAYKGSPGLDLSVTFQSRRAATPLGPASGPHTQMAQNIVLAFLGGCRIMELKTVQILDTLEIPRPCIDARTIGFNVEWSQELSLEESYHEYVVAWILLKVIEAMGWLGVPKGDPFYQTIFDLSVGYDLKGISSPRVTEWIRKMQQAGPYIQKLLASLSEPYHEMRDLTIPPEISSSLTLSTFHGCPREEIEGIVAYLISELNLDVYVKMNPTQLGLAQVDHLLRERMGYRHLGLDEHAFETDLQFDEATAMMKRLLELAHSKGRRCGAKFTNTLVVKNQDTFFTDPVMYLSGTPLHVLSMNALLAFRQAMGEDFPTSFSAGVDQGNFVDTLSCGPVPVTTCTDLLQKGGYSRAVKYLRALEKAMLAAGVSDLDGLHRARADVPGVSANQASLLFAQRHVPLLVEQKKYHHEQNRKPPKKVDSHLATFDCLTCNICLPVCPNGANFSLPIGKQKIEYDSVTLSSAGVVPGPRVTLELNQPAQIANLADFCNECANCEVFCPEFGGPQLSKARFFNSATSFEEAADHHGFYFKHRDTLVGRFEGLVLELSWLPSDERYQFRHPTLGTLVFDEENRVQDAQLAPGAISVASWDTEPFIVMKTFFEALRHSGDYPARFLLPKDQASS